VITIAAIKPPQFSALNALNPLDDEEEHGEDGHCDEDGPKIVHRNS
jgi:hypothetical protein